MNGSRTTGRFPRREKGAVAVEFAIVISLLLLIVGGAIEFGRVFWYYDALSKATRDGARYLSTSEAIDVGTAETRVENAVIAAGIDAVNFTVSVDVGPVTCASGATPPCPTVQDTVRYVTVTTRCDFKLGEWFPVWWLSNGGITPITLEPHTTMRYMR